MLSNCLGENYQQCASNADVRGECRAWVQLCWWCIRSCLKTVKTVVMLAYSLLHRHLLHTFHSPPSLFLPECLQGFQRGEAAWLRDLQRAATQRGTWWPAHGHWQKNQHHILSLTFTTYSVALFLGLHFLHVWLLPVCKYWLRDGRPRRFVTCIDIMQRQVDRG